MKLLEFASKYPDEVSCIAKLQESKEKKPHIFPKGMHTGLEEKQSQLRMQGLPLQGKFVQGLNHGEFRNPIPLPVRCDALSPFKNTFSAMELRCQLGHKHYRPVWEMLHKFREVMAGRDGRYALTGNVKSDEGFFSTEVPDDKKNEELKRGVGGKPSGRITHGRLAEFGFSRTLQAKPV